MSTWPVLIWSGSTCVALSSTTVLLQPQVFHPFVLWAQCFTKWYHFGPLSTCNEPWVFTTDVGPAFEDFLPSWLHMFWIFVTYDIHILAKLNIQCIAFFSKHGLNLATDSVCVLPVLPLPQVFHGGRVAWPAIVVFRPKWRLLCYPTTSSRTSSNSGECCVTLDPTNTQTQSHAGTERLRQAWDYWIKNSIWQQSLSKDATVAQSSYSISNERQLQSWLSFHLGGGMLITGANEKENKPVKDDTIDDDDKHATT